MNVETANKTRSELLNAMAEAGRVALEFEPLSAAALAAIPGTSPEQYVVAGTLPMIAKVLPKDEGAGRAVAWAVTAERGGIHKLSITKESAERKAAVWQKEWPTNGCQVRPLVFGDAQPVAASAAGLEGLTRDRITEIGLSLRMQAFENAAWRKSNNSAMTESEKDECRSLIDFARAIEREVLATQSAKQGAQADDKAFDDVAALWWDAAKEEAAFYVAGHCVDGEVHAKHIMEQVRPAYGMRIDRASTTNKSEG